MNLVMIVGSLLLILFFYSILKVSSECSRIEELREMEEKINEKK